MRNAITNPRTLRRIGRQFGLVVVRAMTRGGTDHRIDALDDLGGCWHLWPDGTKQPADWAVPRERALVVSVVGD